MAVPKREPAPTPTIEPTRAISLGRIVHYVGTGANVARRAAIVTEVTDGRPTLTVFTPRGGYNIVSGVYHKDGTPEHYKGGTWRWPDEAD